ncbi:MAG: GH3 auxin-responsive promoter family protein [Leadbetterella sp.]
MSLINDVLGFFIKRRRLRIDEFKRFPVETQTEVFQKLIERARFTEFGQKYGFAKISTIKQFQESVPVVSYEDFYPWIERVLKGEKNVLWPSDILWFSKSSGTTNARSKFIPVSEESLDECHYRGGRDMLTLYFENKPDSQLFEGKSISIGGSLHPNPFNDTTQVGDISAIITKNIPKWAEFFRIPPPEIALLDNWDKKMEAMVRLSKHENVTGIAGVPTWTVLLLENVMKELGASNMTEVWPNFEVFFHGAVSFAPYRDMFKKNLFPSSKVNYFELYNASEGFFGIQDDFALEDQMLLMLDYGIFYEFLPVGEWESEYPRSLTLDEVELDKTYAVVISTNGGLWRYKIGDTVKFTSRYPFRVKIVGRTKHFLNVFGEEVMVENSDLAWSHVAKEMGFTVKEYTGGPIFMTDESKGGHEWIVECPHIPDDIELAIVAFDKKLREINSDYDAKRHKDMALQLPKVHFVPEGSFYKWMVSKGKLGGQHKVPRLGNSRELIDEVLFLLT